MAKKTWIKVRRGILDPKHRIKLGAAWCLYLYMLDRVNWDTGIIYEWKDQDAADDLEMPLPTLRHQRRHLENELYIATDIKRYGLEITVNNWEDPRNYGVQGDNLLTPCDNEGDNQVDNPLTPLHLINISHNTEHISHDTDEAAPTLYDQLDKTFIDVSGIPKLPKDKIKNDNAIKEMIDIGVTPDILEQAILDMREKKKTIVGLWSLPGPCTVVIGERTGRTREKDAEDPMRYLKGEYGEFGKHW